MSQIERLEALLSRIQRNAAQLSEARANGTYAAAGSPAQAPEAAPMTDPVVAQAATPQTEPTQEELPRAGEFQPEAGGEAPISEAPISTAEDAVEQPSSQSAPETASLQRSDAAPSAQWTTGSGEVPSAAFDETVEAELAAGETSGGWDEGAPADSDDEHAAPRTPPPESGPQMAPPPHSQLPELDDSDDSAPPATHGGHEPSMEQLGSTVDLEPATSGDLEMAPEPAGAAAPAPADEFEEDLPVPDRAGVYNESLRPPTTVQDDLAAVDRAHREREARLSVLPEVTMSMAPDTIAVPPIENPEGEAGVLLRSPIAASTVAATFEGQQRAASRTFLELLDDALGLGG